MPDPRNLQFIDRGIIGALFTDDLRNEFFNLLAVPEVASALLERNIGQALSAIPQRQVKRIRTKLLRNTEKLTSQFEQDFDPLLASVFTVPRINMETQSLWVPEQEISVADGGHYYLKADVIRAGEVIDRIQEDFTVDTSAPEADILISTGDNADWLFEH